MRTHRRELDQVRPVHPLQWLWEPLESDQTFVLRSMFGAKAVYLDGKLMLCFCHGEEPWHGVLICTDRSHHASLIADFPTLCPHAILPKWLYLSARAADFDSTGPRLALLARQRDARLGVAPRPKKRPARARANRP